MKIVLRSMAAAALGLLLWLAAAPAANAQLCSRDSQCGSRFTCQDWFLGLKTCQFARCNADSECASNRECINGLCATVACNSDNDCRGDCIGGICRRPASSSSGGGTGGSGGSGGGSSGGGSGALCGKQTVNGVPHVYGMCRTGFQCLQGRCREIAK